ncbi:hypothetical protein EP7_003429 [Isosphaeraceae bacterium EP7]
MSAAREAAATRTANQRTPTRLRFGLLDLMMTVVLVALGLGVVRALASTPYGNFINGALGLLYLPFLTFGWFRLWTRPISRFQAARHWLLVGFTSGIVVALMAMTSTILQFFSSF